MGELHVQVCYARPGFSFLQNLVVSEGATLQSAIECSGLLKAAPEINLEIDRVGVWGKLKTRDTVLRERDRVEVYRSLTADPKESRRKRAMGKGQKAG